MKSIANQYRDLKEGRMSQANFMRNLRMSMPQYVTNTTSFNDAVKILKNKAILTEAALGEESLLDELESEMENGKSYADAISIVAAKHGIGEDALATKYPEEAVGNKAYEDGYFDEAKEMELGDPEVKVGDIVVPNKGPHKGMNHEVIHVFPDGTFNIKPKWAGLTAKEIKYKLGAARAKISDVEVLAEAENPTLQNPENVAELVANKHADKLIALRSDIKKFEDAALNLAGQEMLAGGMNKTAVGNLLSAYGYFEDWAPEYLSALDKELETQSMVSKIGQEKAGEEAVMGQYDLSEAKKKKAEPKAELHPNKIHPQELRMGIKVELEHTDDLDKAKKIALDHLAENPYYYTALKLSGIESPSAPKVKAPVEKKAKKKETVELVDKENQMKPVPKKKLKESNVGERMMFQDLPADSEKYQIKKDTKGKIVQATNDEGNVFSMNDEAIAIDNGEKIKIAGFKEEQGKVKALFKVSTGMFFDAIDIDGLKPVKRSSGVNLGGSFDSFKSQLEEMVREVLAEIQSDEQETDEIAMELDEYFFDGRDNLADEIAAQQK